MTGRTAADLQPADIGERIRVTDARDTATTAAGILDAYTITVEGHPTHDGARIRVVTLVDLELRDLGTVTVTGAARIEATP